MVFAVDRYLPVGSLWDLNCTGFPFALGSLSRSFFSCLISAYGETRTNNSVSLL